MSLVQPHSVGPWSDYDNGGDPGYGAPMPASPAPQAGGAVAAPPAADGPWSDYAAPAAAPAGQPSVIPAPAVGPHLSQEVSSPTEVKFGDDQTVVHTQMSPEMKAQYDHILRTGTADDAINFLQSNRFASNEGELRHFFAGRDYANQHGGKVNYDVAYKLPEVQTSQAGAFGRGAAQGASLGFADELQGLGSGVNAALHGGGFTDAYNRSMDASHADLAADDRDHWKTSLAGNLAGGLALPIGLEKAGVTASVRATGVAARDAAIAAGVEPATADRIAARAIAHRLAAEGATYGGINGAGTSDGSPSQRLAGAAGGAAVGALGGAAVPYIDKGIRVGRNAAVSTGNAVGDVLRGAVGSVTQSGAADRAANVIRGSAQRPIADILNDIATRGASVDGVQPTLAEVAKDAGIAGMQRGHTNTDNVAGSAIALRQQKNALARTHAVTSSLDEGVSPQALQDHAASELGRGEAMTAQQQAAQQAAISARLASGVETTAAARSGAEQGLAGARDTVGPLVDRTATGSSVRETFDAAYGAAKQRSSQAYTTPALTQPHPIDIPSSVFQKVRDAADAFYGDGGGEIPASLQSIIGDMADPNATTRTLTNIDRRLADFAGEAKMQGRKSEGAFAERVRGTLNNFVNEAAPQEYRDALSNAKSVRAEQGRIFETGDAPKPFASDRYGNPVVGDTTIPGKLVRPGAPGGDTADGLIAAIGHGPAEDVVRQELRRTLDEGNVTTADQARAVATKFGEVAKRFPGVQQDLADLHGHASRLDEARAAEVAAGRATPTPDEKAALSARSALHDSILASPMGKLADPGTDPSTYVGQLMNRSDDGRQFRMLASQVSAKPEALSGLRQSLGDYIEKAGAGPNFNASGDRIPAPNPTRKAIDTVISRAGSALTNEQKIVLKAVSRELEQLNFAYSAAKPAGSETAVNMSFQQLMENVPFIPSRGKSMIGKVLKAFSNGDDVKRLTTQAILDPDFAATLLKRPTPKHWERVQSNMLGRSASLARGASLAVRSAAAPIANAPANRMSATK